MKWNFLKKDILITKNYPKFDIFMNAIAYPIGERLVGIGLLSGILVVNKPIC